MAMYSVHISMVIYRCLQLLIPVDVYSVHCTMYIYSPCMSVCVNCVLEVLEVPSPVELFSEAIVKSKDSGVDQLEQDRPCNLFQQL